MPRVPRLTTELIEALIEQLQFLRSSARAVDQGEQYEFKRLAMTLRVLLHSGRRPTQALLDQIGVLGKLQFLDSAGENPPNNKLRAQNLLALQQLTWGGGGVPSRGGYIARMHNLPDFKLDWRTQVHELAAGRSLPRKAGEYLDFDTWWSAVVLTDGLGAEFSRADLVRAVANTDGGGHVDPTLDASYYALSRSNSLGWIMTEPSGEQLPFDNPVPASIRQIAYEVDVSLVRAAELFPGVDLGEVVVGPGPHSPS